MGQLGFPSADVLLSAVSFFRRDQRKLFPAFVESCLSWLAAIFLATYLGFCYIVSTNGSLRQYLLRSFLPLLSIGTTTPQQSPKNDIGEIICRHHHVPLTTTTRGDDTSFQEALDSLEVLLGTMQQKRKDVASTTNTSTDDDIIRVDWSADPVGLEELMRSSVPARRLASIAMQLELKHIHDKHKMGSLSTASNSKTALALWKQIIVLWPHLLQLPSNKDIHEKQYKFQISLVVPAYAEQGKHIQANLQRAHSSSQNPSQIQLVLVDAGKNTDLEQATVFDTATTNGNGHTLHKSWGEIQVIRFTAGGGRGPTLNCGAKHATGKIITFLHSDNILPRNWDEQIITTLFGPNKQPIHSEQQQQQQQLPSTTSDTIACALSFKIDTSKKALDGGDYPPGLGAAQWLGTIRTERFQVLYGDSVLSMPAAYFRYLGGYPEQALMEDYEVMDLLRKRVALSLPSASPVKNRIETVRILPAETLISPRRWQIKGVTFVTLFNCLCVFLYEHRGWSPEELYKLYYQRQSSSN